MPEKEPYSISEVKAELGNMSFRDLLYKYIRFLPLFILSTAFALLLAFLYLRYTIPIYNVGGTILIKNEQSGKKGDSFEDLYVNNKTQNIQSEMEVLKSKPLMTRVVERLGLQFSYSVKGKIKKNVNIYTQGPFLIRARNVVDSNASFNIKVKYTDATHFRINDTLLRAYNEPFTTPYGTFVLIPTGLVYAKNEYNVLWQPSSVVAAGLTGSLTVIPKSAAAGIISISMKNTNSVLGADIVNTLMEDYAEYSKDQKKLSYNQILAFIAARMITYGGKLDTAQKRLLDFQIRNNLIDGDAQTSTNFDRISETDKSVNEQMIRLNTADMITEYLSNKKNANLEIPVVPSTFGIEDATLSELVTGYNTAVLKRREFADSKTPEGNPLLKEAEDRIETLRLSIIENLRNIKSATNVTIGRLRNITSVSETQLREMPGKMKELSEIKQEVETYLGLYKYLQEKKEETEISRESIIPNSQVVDKAVPTSEPVSPNRNTIQILAILVGLGLPALAIFVMEVLNDKITSRFDIEKITAAPIVGEIGHSFQVNALVVNSNTRGMVAEQFRIIRSNLQYILSNKEKSVILTTSSMSGEGKSFISTNMGAVLALAGKKTVMLEFDIRKPKLLSNLGMKKGEGISNYLVGKAKLEDLIRPVPEHDNLFVLGCGPIPPNPSELLLDKRVEEMFDWLKANYDMVVVDTAPVGMVSDALTLSKYADATLYLVRQGHTFKKQIALIDDFYQEDKLPHISIVINDVKIKPGYGYYGYGRYGYGSGYGYGGYYEEEKAPESRLEKFLDKVNLLKYFRKKKKKK